jgi:hypothetical protein
MAAGSIYGDQSRVGRTMGDHPAPRTQTVVAINSKAAAPLDEVNIIADAETYSGNIDVFCSCKLTKIVIEKLDKLLSAQRMV